MFPIMCIYCILHECSMLCRTASTTQRRDRAAVRDHFLYGCFGLGCSSLPATAVAGAAGFSDASAKPNWQGKNNDLEKAVFNFFSLFVLKGIFFEFIFHFV